MIVWVVDCIGFLLLCVGSKLATPRLFKVLCRFSALYLFVFTLCYYFWLAKYRYFLDHPQYLQPGISLAFRFEGFWKLLGNMVLLQGVLPVAVVVMVYLGIKWLLMGQRADVRR